ncbi:Nif3-like dinuclear metal center hexameric protein [Desulfoplanes sp.]
MRPEQVIARIEKDAPLRLAALWDKSGLQIRGKRGNISRIALALDPTPTTVRMAIEQQADFILTHHPLSLSPRFPAANDELYRTMSMVMEEGIWLYAAHTTLDAQPAGPVNWLAACLGLSSTGVLEPTTKRSSLLVRIHKNKDLPSLEHPQVISRLDHDRMTELIVWKDQWPGIQKALEERTGGPLEHHAVELASPVGSYGFGCIGDLSAPMQWSSFRSLLGKTLGTAHWTRIGAPPKEITRIAYCPGSGGSLGAGAFDRGAQIYITGDVKYHQAQDIEHLGTTIDVGHHVLEERMMDLWHTALRQDLESRDTEVTFLPSRDPLHIENVLD